MLNVERPTRSEQAKPTAKDRTVDQLRALSRRSPADGVSSPELPLPREQTARMHNDSTPNQRVELVSQALLQTWMEQHQRASVAPKDVGLRHITSGETQQNAERPPRLERSAPAQPERTAHRRIEQMSQQLAALEQRPRDSNTQRMPHREIFAANYAKVSEQERTVLRNNEQGSIQELPVAELPDPEGVQGPQDFNHHITYEDAKLHTQQLNEIVVPWVRAGAVGEDFRALDQSLGKDPHNGYYETYRLFYGNEPIAVGRTSEGSLDITGGRHRIYMAKEQGLQKLPVRLIGEPH